MNNSRQTASPSGDALQLVLATGALAVCFAAFGSVSAMMPILTKKLGLDAVQVSVALASPVLLGSLGRIRLGMLTDRFGGRAVFSVVMAVSIAPVMAAPFVSDYRRLIACGFFMGVTLAGFSVGASFVSGWYRAEKQGMALGVYGAGNVGQSLAAFGSPVLAAAFGFKWGFWAFGVLLAAWLALFSLKARNPPLRAPAKSFGEALKPLRDAGCWALSLYYFFTFGGFVTMAICLPTFLTEMFRLTPRDAGICAAGFVLLATAMRFAGGMLADRVGGRRVLMWVFPASAAMAALLACPNAPTFMIGAMGMAAAVGLGNGAVFKLVPEYFPQSVGAATGLVSAAGGLGGFFPPLVFGAVRQATGAFTPGFWLLALFAAACAVAVFKFQFRRKGIQTSHETTGLYQRRHRRRRHFVTQFLR